MRHQISGGAIMSLRPKKASRACMTSASLRGLPVTIS